MTIKEKFSQLKKENRKAFIAYVPYGFPTIAYTKKIMLTLQEAGVDILELGIPFSDPVSDGPIIQEATSIALKNGANTKNLFLTLNEIKKDIEIPVAVMTYFNPVFKFGIEDFFSKMKDAGVSGILTVDLPIDEASTYIKLARKNKIETIFFVTPVTPIDRAQKIINASSGFIYYISVTGITGMRNISYSPIKKHVLGLRKLTDLPVCVGFGIHSKEQIHKVQNFCDGAIVGSAIVKFIKENYSKSTFFDRLKKYVKSLKQD